MTSVHHEDMKESIVIQTFPDNQLHRYVTSIDLDSDKAEIRTTCTLHFPYDKDLMAYWVPGTQTLAVYGGAYDKEEIFIGRVAEVEQTGYEIQVTCENIGWKFYQTATTSFMEGLEGKTVIKAVEAIFKYLKVDYELDLFGIPNIDNYTVKSDGTVELDGETIDEIPELTDVVEGITASDIKYNDALKKTTMTTFETAADYASRKKKVQIEDFYYPSSDLAKYKRPEIRQSSKTFLNDIDLATVDVIGRSEDVADLASKLNTGLEEDPEYLEELLGDESKTQEGDTSAGIGGLIGNITNGMSIISSTVSSFFSNQPNGASDYNSQMATTIVDNAKLIAETQKKQQEEAAAAAAAAASSNSGSGGTSGGTTGTSDSSGTGGTSSSSSDTTQAEPTEFNTILENIASSIDAHFYIVGTKVYFLSFVQLLTGDKSKTGFPTEPITIDYWMQEDETFELNINAYGFYNSVYVNYKNGTVNACNDDLIKVFSEVPIEYDEKDLSYPQAKLKAQAYLMAHTRDYGMEISVDILYTGKIQPGCFVKVRNPRTMTENLYYVRGINMSWSANENTFSGSLDLRFGPENPDNPEIPETGAGYASGDEESSSGYFGEVSADVCEAAKQITSGIKSMDAKIKSIFDWVDVNISYVYYYNDCKSDSQVLQEKTANCVDSSQLLSNMFNCIGAKNRILTSGSVTMRDGRSYAHWWNSVYYQGQWVCADAGRSSTGNFNPCNHSAELNGNIREEFG